MYKIEEQLKLSRKQKKEERYQYLCKEFNAIKYAMDLEKYIIKLKKDNKKILKENKTLKRIKDNYISHLQQDYEIEKIKMLNNINFIR